MQEQENNRDHDYLQSNQFSTKYIESSTKYKISNIFILQISELITREKYASLHLNAATIEDGVPPA